MEYYGINGKRYVLEDVPFKGGGEGNVHLILGEKDICAKIYNANCRLYETERKLHIMMKMPPNKSVLSQIAWPIDILYSIQNEFMGFVMPKIDVSDELISVYEYPPTKYKELTFVHKLIIAQNICAVIDGVHNAGFVFGDFNPNNIGVDMQTGRVAFWDTDSYHIKDNELGIVYRCKVCLDGYVAPELLKKCKIINPETGKGYNYENAPLDTFTQETDRFALAIHIFKLLMNGYTPFNGIVSNAPLTSTLIPGIGNNAIENDQYCFKDGMMPLSKAVPDKNVLPKEILKLFNDAFIEGRNNPHLRPSAREWHKALGNYEQNLVQCRANTTHQYIRGLRKCPWCEIDKKFSVGIQKAVMQQSHLLVLNDNTKTINTTNVKSVSVKNKINKKAIFLIVMIAVIIFVIYDANRVFSNMQPEYKVLFNDCYYKTMDEDGKTQSFFIVDGLNGSDSKEYSFIFEGEGENNLKIRTDTDVTLSIKLSSKEKGIIFYDAVACFAGVEKELTMDVNYGDEVNVEVFCNNEEINYTIGINY